MKKNYKDWEKILYKIFLEGCKIDFFIDSKLKTEKLLGNKINLNARDLLYVFMILETEYGVVFSAEEVEKGSFDTFSNILSLIIY